MAFEINRDMDIQTGKGPSALMDEMRKITDLRDSRIAETEHGVEALTAVIAFQMEDGSFSLVSDYAIPGDARVDFIYRPTYACCQILTQALLAGIQVEGLESALARGLAFSCGRNLVGHGFSGMKQQLEDMADFADAGMTELLATRPELCPQFAELVASILDAYANRIDTGKTIGDFGTDFAREITDVLEAFGRTQKTAVFVYGTLLEGMRADSMLAGSPHLGEATLHGFDLYDLGSYPGIKHSRDKSSQVLGEVRLCDADTLRRLHYYESEGVLYDFEHVMVELANGEEIPAYAYVYRYSVDESSLIPLQLQPYRKTASLKETHVWYVSYGSNILAERFAAYVQGGRCRFNGRSYYGCDDPTPPVASTYVEIPYDIYFGNESGSWNYGGAAFLDVSKPGMAHGRAYLVTKEQFAQIHLMEGASANWYPDKVRLGELAGIPMVTFTNKRRRPANAPSEAYLDVVRKGLKEVMPAVSSDDIDAYLQAALAR